MNDRIKEDSQEINDFTEKTRKEVRIWDWLGRVLPLTALFTLAVLHFTDLHDFRDMLLNISLVAFVTVCFVWWYWALRKIISSVKYIHRAHERFLEIARELKKLRIEIKKDDSDRQR